LCNLYSLTKGQQAIREWAGVMNDRTGNLPPLPDIFPDYAAPIVRNQPDGRELTMARWGMGGVAKLVEIAMAGISGGLSLSRHAARSMH
jgi:putative SOS response-associated peptidase YedK